MKNHALFIAESSNQCAALGSSLKKDGSLSKVIITITVDPDKFKSYFIESVQKTGKTMDMPTVSNIQLL